LNQNIHSEHVAGVASHILEFALSDS
jgi:hypothetical protein